MLALVAIFLVTLIASATSIWMYRKISGWHGFSKTVVGRPKAAVRMNRGLQYGFVQLTAKHKAQMAAKTRGQIKLARRRTPKGGYEAPWGW